MLLPSTPFYLDWTFWTAMLALVAIALSQVPPIHLLLRPKRLEVEVHSRIRISHVVGNPSASIVVSVRNTGGRELRVRSLHLDVVRDGKELISLPGLSYFETPSSKVAVLFVPFTIKPGDTWARSVWFLNELDRQTEKNYRQNLSALNADIRDRIKVRADDNHEAVEADPKLVRPFLDLFEKSFVWQPDEYVANLKVQAEPGSASFSKRYRFTLFESDTHELQSYTDDYKFGGGITFWPEHHSGVNISLSEQRS